MSVLTLRILFVSTIFRKTPVAVPVAPRRLPDDVHGLHLEIYALRDEIFGVQARLAQAEVIIKKYRESEASRISMEPAVHVEYLESAVADLEYQVREIKSSSTWKLGRLLLFPVRLFKR